jgi:hypothetical protein
VLVERSCTSVALAALAGKCGSLRLACRRKLENLAIAITTESGVTWEVGEHAATVW